jgi:hypothetical protein
MPARVSHIGTCIPSTLPSAHIPAPPTRYFYHLRSLDLFVVMCVSHYDGFGDMIYIYMEAAPMSAVSPRRFTSVSSLSLPPRRPPILHYAAIRGEAPRHYSDRLPCPSQRRSFIQSSKAGRWRPALRTSPPDSLQILNTVIRELKLFFNFPPSPSSFQVHAQVVLVISP